MKNLSQYLCKTCHNTNNHSMHSKGSKFVIPFYWLENDLSCYVISKNVKKIHEWLKNSVLRPPLVKCCSLSFFSVYVST